MKNLDVYPFEIRPLSTEDGGGFLITYPDFNGCISDGETIEEAMQNGREALTGMIKSLKALKKPIPSPTPSPRASGRFVARIPKTLHSQLSRQAKTEGVSLNTLVVSFIASGLGKKSAR